MPRLLKRMAKMFHSVKSTASKRIQQQNGDQPVRFGRVLLGLAQSQATATDFHLLARLESVPLGLDHFGAAKDGPRLHLPISVAVRLLDIVYTRITDRSIHPLSFEQRQILVVGDRIGLTSTA